MSNPPNDAKAVFGRCGTCSQTFAHLLNRAFAHRDERYEVALDPLAGGIFREGHQCGMLWGATLAVGAEAFRRSDTPREAQAMALGAAAELVKSFEQREHSIECREITGVRMNRFSGLLVQTLLKGMDKSKCFELAEDWMPEAIAAGEEGLAAKPEQEAPAHNCAAQVLRNLGASEEEATMVAGFAGGIGLSGKGCGALAAVIWWRSLQ